MLILQNNKLTHITVKTVIIVVSLIKIKEMSNALINYEIKYV